MRLHHRITAAAATAALALGAGLVAASPATAETAPSTASPAAAASFTGLSISGLKKKVTVPKYGKSRNVTFTVNISGTASDGGVSDVNGDGLAVDYKDYDADFYGAKIVNLKSKVKSPYAPFVTSPSALATGANTYSFKLSYSTAPGLYELRVPVTQNDWTSGTRVSVTKIATVRFKVLANKQVSKRVTSYYAPGWKNGATAKFTFRAPEYQKGAKVTLYYKTSKSKKFVKITSAKLKVKKGAYNSQAILKTKKLYPGHKIYFKVGKTKWAPAYKTKTVPIVRR